MSLKNAFGGVALIAGTAIGAAILALPISTAHLGFIQTVSMYVVCWSFMTLGALYLLEVNLGTGIGSNLITMAEKTLGTPGKIVTWLMYLLLLYTLTAAYLSGGGKWFQEGLNVINLSLSQHASIYFATGLTVFIIFLGTAVTDWVNRIFMIGLISAFSFLLMKSFGHIKPAQLLLGNFPFDVRPIPLIITAFGSAIVIPTLTQYLKGKPRQLFYVVLTGSIIPLLVYIMWEITMVGIIPYDHLLDIQTNGHPVTDVPNTLQTLLRNPSITFAASYFSIFALLTSLLGVSLSLFDFLADGLKIKKNIPGKLALSVVAFLPPLLFILFFEKGFSFILSFAGIFVSVLLGILPALMVWKQRYQFNQPRMFALTGSKILIVLTIFFFIAVIGIEGFNQYAHAFR